MIAFDPSSERIRLLPVPADSLFSPDDGDGIEKGEQEHQDYSDAVPLSGTESVDGGPRAGKSDQREQRMGQPNEATGNANDLADPVAPDQKRPPSAGEGKDDGGLTTASPGGREEEPDKQQQQITGGGDDTAVGTATADAAGAEADAAANGAAGKGAVENLRKDESNNIGEITGTSSSLNGDDDVEEMEYSVLTGVRIVRGPSITELEKRKQALEKWKSLEPGGIVTTTGPGDASSGAKGKSVAGGSSGLDASSMGCRTPSKTAGTTPTAASRGRRRRAGGRGGKAGASPKSIGKKQARALGTLAVGGLATAVAAMGDKGKDSTTAAVQDAASSAAPSSTV